jgi:hypothetical protein
MRIFEKGENRMNQKEIYDLMLSGLEASIERYKKIVSNEIRIGSNKDALFAKEQYKKIGIEVENDNCLCCGVDQCLGGDNYCRFCLIKIGIKLNLVKTEDGCLASYYKDNYKQTLKDLQIIHKAITTIKEGPK